MPKRKRSKEEDMMRIQRKIKKLENKLNKRLNSASSDTASDLEEVLPTIDHGAGIYLFVLLFSCSDYVNYLCTTNTVVGAISTHVKHALRCWRSFRWGL